MVCRLCNRPTVEEDPEDVCSICKEQFETSLDLEIMDEILVSEEEVEQANQADEPTDVDCGDFGDEC